MDNPGKNQANIYLSDKVADEIEAYAKNETKRTGHETTKTKLVREIFNWAYPVYQRCGSLAVLKQLSPDSFGDVVERSLKIDAEVFNRGSANTKSKRKKAG